MLIQLLAPNYSIIPPINAALNPLTSGSDENANSSYNIHTLSRKQMVKILKLIKQSCYFKLTPNSHNQLTRKCVAAGRANEQSDLGSERVKRLTLFFLICLLHVGSEKDEDGFYFKGNTSVPSYHRTEELQPSTENWDDQGNQITLSIELIICELFTYYL